MKSLTILALATGLALAGTSSFAQKAAPDANVNGVKLVKAAPTKSTASRKQLKSEAAGLALAVETTQAISENQLAIAQRVLTGRADCEFSQQVDIQAIEGKPGHFKVGYKNSNYTMVPEETTTGAVRLEDKKAGVVWLQIPAKSMLMNHKIGQRMVDSCTQREQRVAAESGRPAPSIGFAQ